VKKSKKALIKDAKELFEKLNNPEPPKTRALGKLSVSRMLKFSRTSCDSTEIVVS
jgi:hypothetical protein